MTAMTTMTTMTASNTNQELGRYFMKKEAEQKEKRAEIREKFPEIEFPDPILEPIYFGRTHKTAVDNKTLIRDANRGTQYAIVSSKYHIVYHENVIRNIIEAIPEEFGEPKFNIHMFGKGARMRATVVFPEIHKEVNGSELNLLCRVGNSYDTSLHLSWEWGAKELVCSNGLIAFVSKEKARAKHLYGAISKIEITKNLNAALEDFSEQHNIWIQWNETKLSELQIDEAFKRLPFSKNEKEKMKELPLINHGGISISTMPEPTLWAVNSAATQYAKHEVHSPKRAYELESKIARTMSTFSHILN